MWNSIWALSLIHLKSIYVTFEVHFKKTADPCSILEWEAL